MSNESLALPPTHFLILQVLTFLILIGYIISVLPVINAVGFVPIESSLLFGLLSVLYLLFYNVSLDLNDLYSGVFQIRRGSSASHLLEVKQQILDHPWLNGAVSFDCVDSEVRCGDPSLADAWFENEQGYTMR